MNYFLFSFLNIIFLILMLENCAIIFSQFDSGWQNLLFFQNKNKKHPQNPSKCNVGGPIKWLSKTHFGFALQYISCSAVVILPMEKKLFSKKLFFNVVFSYEGIFEMSSNLVRLCPIILNFNV